MNESGFSNSHFINAVVSESGVSAQVMALPVVGSGPDRTMYGLQTIDKRGLKRISLAPFGLYASPGWEGNLELTTVRSIMKRIKKLDTASFNWTVRFDQIELARLISRFSPPLKEHSTHVLRLQADYERVFGGFNATTRNEIRRSQKNAVEVLDVKDDQNVEAFHRLYVELQNAKGRKIPYSAKMFKALARLDTTRLLIAKFDGVIVAGGLFFDDGISVYYWQGVNDRKFEKLYPTHAILNAAISGACKRRVSFFDFGASVGNASLEAFKSFWGATKVPYWSFQWRNPYWNLLWRIEANAARLLRLPQKLMAASRVD